MQATRPGTARCLALVAWRGVGDAQAVTQGGGGGGSWRDSLRWAEGGGGCYTIDPGKAEHLQIPAPERGEHPIPAGRAAAEEKDEVPRLSVILRLSAFSPPLPPAAALSLPPVQQSEQRQPAELGSEPGTELETLSLCQPRRHRQSPG